MSGRRYAPAPRSPYRSELSGLAFHERFRGRKAIALLGVLAGLVLLLK
jgi:hypothetical protein